MVEGQDPAAKVHGLAVIPATSESELKLLLFGSCRALSPFKPPGVGALIQNQETEAGN